MNETTANFFNRNKKKTIAAMLSLVLLLSIGTTASFATSGALDEMVAKGEGENSNNVEASAPIISCSNVQGEGQGEDSTEPLVTKATGVAADDENVATLYVANEDGVIKYSEDGITWKEGLPEGVEIFTGEEGNDLTVTGELADGGESFTIVFEDVDESKA